MISAKGSCCQQTFTMKNVKGILTRNLTEKKKMTADENMELCKGIEYRKW